MHGVLMHGDGETGDDHKNEDTYLRLQTIDAEKAKQAEGGVGPCKGNNNHVIGIVLDSINATNVKNSSRCKVDTSLCSFEDRNKEVIVASPIEGNPARF